MERLLIWPTYKEFLTPYNCALLPIESGGDPNASGPQLTDTWEVYASALILSEAGGDSVTLKGPNHPDNTFQDPSEPYFWTPDNGSAFASWIQALGTGEITLTLDDGTPNLLSLFDFPTTGRFVDAAALLVASADTLPVPSSFYADSDYGGTDTPLEGELGLGPDNSIIGRLRRQLNDAVATLTLNDDDNPLSFSIGDYFADGGAGRGLTMTLQTSAGSADMDAVTYYRRGGGSFAHWTLSTEFQALLDPLVTGDRFIIAFWRAYVDHAVDATPVEFTFTLPTPTVNLMGDHFVNVGTIGFTFTLPQPTITVLRNLQVNAGAVEFTFTLPEVTGNVVHHSEVNAGAVSFTFALPRPSVTLARDHNVNAGAIGFIFTVSQIQTSREARLTFAQRIATGQRADLLVLQWQGTKLRPLLDAYLRTIFDKLVLPLQALEFTIDEAEGWQLDVIGARIGFPRPTSRATDVPVFGFEGAGAPVVGFDQGYFRSVDERLSPSRGINDGQYKRLLKMRGKLLFSRYTIPEMDSAVQEVIAHAVYQDHGNGDLTLYVGTEQTPNDLALYAPLWPRPATVLLTVNDAVSLPI